MEPTLRPGQFFGSLLLRRESGPLVLSETQYPGGLRVPRHSHENGYFCFIRKGQYHETYGNRKRYAAPSMIAFHPPGEMHSESFEGGEVLSFNVEVDPRWLSAHGGTQRLFEEASYFDAGVTEFYLLRMYREFREFDPVAPLAIEGLVLETLAEAARFAARPCSNSYPPRWIFEVRNILESRFHETVSLCELANEVGIHPVYLAAAFRKHQRCTVGDYVRRLRIDFARGQILRSNLSLAEIAAAAGFADQSHFTRSFKRLTGTTPQVYRRLARGNR